MKILELNLLAFGPFTNIPLDLSAGREGLHVIYGPNEAGKSSALRALKGLLYGIPANTTDNFLHDNPALRLGGRLMHPDGSEIRFIRRKGTKRTLMDTEGNPLEDHSLEKFLGGVGEQMFAAVFGINHDILVSGGKDLLRGGGEAGQSLFAAGLGTTGITEFLDELDAEMRALFLPSGTKPSINRAISDYKDTKKKVAELSLPCREWSQHHQALEDAVVKREKLVTRLKALSRERNRLERLQQALPRIAKRGMLLLRLQALGEVVRLTPEFSQERREATDTLRRAEDTYSLAENEMQKLREHAETLTVSEGLLHQSKTITALHQRLGAYLKASRDLPGLEGSMQELENRATATMAELQPGLSLSQAEKIRLTTAQRAAIQELAGHYQALVADLERGRRDVKKAREGLATAKEALRELPADKDPADLQSAVRKSQEKGNLEEAAGKAKRELAKAKEQAQVDLERFVLWSGTIEELEKLPVPASETVDQFESKLSDLLAELSRLDEKIAEARDAGASLEQQLEALRLAGEVPSEVILCKAREERDQGWQLVRRAWLDQQEVSAEVKAYDPNRDLPEAYEKRVAEADLVADRLRREAERVATQAALEAARQQQMRTRHELEVQKMGVQEHLAHLQQEWLELWAPCALVPLTPREMRPWLTRHQHLADEAATIRNLRQEVKGLQNEIVVHKNQLANALANIGAPEPELEETLEALKGRCLQVVETFQRRTQRKIDLAARIEELEKELAQARHAEEAAAKSLEKWQQQWGTALVALGLSGEATPTAAQAVLNEMEELFKSLDKAAGFRVRIAGIERDAQQFQRDVERLVARVAPDLVDLPPEQAAAELQARLTQTQKDAAKLENLEGQIEEKKEVLEQTGLTIQIARKRLETLCQQAGCRDWRDLEAIEARSQECQDLEKKITDLEEQILEQSAGATLEAFIAEAETVTADEIPGQIEEIDQQIEQLEEERTALDQGIGKERNELAKMDGNAAAAAAAEKAQEILALIRVDSEHYIRLRLAAALLRREIERYREENQGTLINRAAALFNALTLGHFASLAVDYNDQDEPILQGVRPTGQRISVEGMSDGTVDQLYLALRLATLEKYLETYEPLPFVVDDILIKFDDYRAEATLRVLFELARRTQVIFFTHHQRLVELARKVSGEDNLKVHQLS